MEEALTLAGILEPRLAGPTHLSLVPEPEAASLSILLECYDSIKNGDVYIVCDAWGTTVDLITYEIKSIQPIRMSEAFEGQIRAALRRIICGLCGGAFIYEAFEQTFRQRLGTEWKDLSKDSKREVMKGYWEEFSYPRFTTGNPQKEYIVRLTIEIFLTRWKRCASDGTKAPSIKHGKIHLKERTAICQGVVRKGFADGLDGGSQIQSHKPLEIKFTIYRASYGVKFRTTFVKGKHLEEDKVWCDVEGKWVADNQMEWNLTKV
ncbi:hypothetical protein EDB80DRAFT_883822 [Ilyonectria destructans]|nr:hypothetical protein EDB80DRAFT_883822 [Ilyonectria destructans]